MSDPTSRSAGDQPRCRLPILAVIIAASALFVGLGGSAWAAKGHVGAKDLATGAVNTRAIKDGTITPSDLNASTREALEGEKGETGAPGVAGVSGTNGTNGANGTN